MNTAGAPENPITMLLDIYKRQQGNLIIVIPARYLDQLWIMSNPFRYHTHPALFIFKITLRLPDKSVKLKIILSFLSENISCRYLKKGQSLWDCSFEHPKHTNV